MNSAELLKETQDAMLEMMKDIADAQDLLDDTEMGMFSDQMLMISVRAQGLAIAGAYLDR